MVSGVSATVNKSDVIEALRSVDDPEYPGISVVDMGMIDGLEICSNQVTIDLLTTFSGCPAAEMIASDVAEAVHKVHGVNGVEVRRSTHAWDTSRLSETAREAMARDFTVAVASPSQPAQCPCCASKSLVEQSLFGPARCRAVHRCKTCGEIVEVLRA